MASAFEAELSEIHPKTAAEWRSWLEKNHAEADGVWLIYYRVSTGKRELTWQDAVREALCFGWIDSKAKRLDDERYKQIFTPRKPNSVWSKVNKQNIEELVAADRMTDAGMRAVEVAKENGAWSILDPIDALIIPADLQAALDATPTASDAYSALSASAKRLLLYSVYMAKREETRAKRIAAAITELSG